MEELFDHFRSGQNITSTQISEEGEYPVYGGNGLRGFTNRFTHEGFFLLIGRQGALCGNINRSNGKTYISEHAIACRANDTSDTEWLAQRLDYFKLNRLSESSAQPGLSVSKLQRFKLTVPSLPEQQKIAQFLTAVDKRIQLLTRKKEQLELYKKGTMQQIFNREIRFKDENGKDFPEWEEKKLGEVANIFDGTHQTPKYVDSGVPFYSVEHISANQFSNTKFISEEVFKKENKRVRLEKEDILMTRIGSIGVAKHIDWDVMASFYVSLALIKSNKSFCSRFLAFAINSVAFQRELWRRTIHVAFPQKINLGEIGQCLIHFPCIAEQQKIAQFLSALDKKIEHTTGEIEKMKEWKRGLLQKMFV